MVPIGGIIAWSGLLAEIPVGYALCDGTNGTPDLNFKFPVGAGVILDPGDVGGDFSHTHAVGLGSHTHSVNDVDFSGSGPGTDLWHAQSDGALTDPTNISGVTDSGQAIPPYVALAYIMRLS